MSWFLELKTRKLQLQQEHGDLFTSCTCVKFDENRETKGRDNGETQHAKSEAKEKSQNASTRRIAKISNCPEPKNL